MKQFFTEDNGRLSMKRLCGLLCVIALCVTMYHNSFSDEHTAPATILVESAGLVFGGFSGPAVTGATELYNGTSWTSTGNMTTARRIIGSATASPNSASLVFGGLAPATSNATEEFTNPVLAVQTITTS